MAMNLVKVDGNTKEDLLNALKSSIVEIDLDLSGENGIEYTRADALDNGFETTIEYIADNVKNIEDNEELVKAFYDECFQHDTYYSHYEYATLTNDSGVIYAIAISTTVAS